MVETTALDLVQIPIDLADAALELLRALVQDRVAIAGQHRDVAVVEVDDFPRLGEDRGDIARDVVLAVAKSDQQRASLPRGDDLVLVLAGDDGDSIGPLDLPERFDHCIFEVFVERLLDEMGDYFGVSLRSELMSARLESLLQCAGVLDDAVVDDRYVALAVYMRVRVAFIRDAMGRPTRMADSGVPLDRLGRESPLQLRDLSRRLAGLDARAVHHGHAGGVVPAILHPLESF